MGAVGVDVADGGSIRVSAVGTGVADVGVVGAGAYAASADQNVS